MSSGSSYRKSLSRPVVVREALALLDAEGADALTMRALADRLGVVPNALYRHVKDKDDLLDGVLDAAIALVPLPDPGLPWDDGMVALANAMRDTMLEHPPITALVVGRPNLGIAALVLGEYAFTVLLGSGFTERDAERALNLVLTYTLGFVALEVPRRFAPEVSAAELQEIYGQIDWTQFPSTLRVLPGEGEIVSEDQFRFGLARIVESLRPFAGLASG